MSESDRTSSPVPVVAAVIRGDGGRVLLARRSRASRHGGLWEFPGGKVEDGETPEGALIREIREELGVEIEVGAALAQVNHDYAELCICLTAFDCRIVAGTPRALDCWEVAWVAPSDISSYPMPEADVPIARLLCRREVG
jgi:8-oxo-dGTP diphosphatase